MSLSKLLFGSFTKPNKQPADSQYWICDVCGTRNEIYEWTCSDCGHEHEN